MYINISPPRKWAYKETADCKHVDTATILVTLDREPETLSESKCIIINEGSDKKDDSVLGGSDAGKTTSH